MFGDQALILINDARRSTASDTLLKYNDETVRLVRRELRVLDSDIASTIGDNLAAPTPPPGVMCASTFYHIAIRRNIRCLLAYHAHRIDRLKDQYWASGGALPHVFNDQDTRQKLSPYEVDFLRGYNSLIMEYRSDLIDTLDIAAGITHPPKDLHVLVQVVRDCGTIHTENGTIDFQKGQRFMVTRSDVEHLLVQGYLELV
ncbi:hypothetical protein BOTBODRAFT_43274 [Botryobasidium botryosum FD-172 SS1]|uniref:DNA replication complex GINS protein PSF1 n=1 Tax=Botryobasidium botryosum (strain FD-172 SS1) TaxID=930990 RepID=A0A067MYP6_BOTB1|nr:hypothetical protein BOTBODRAFT_43274 [Botryobasidium botryosum FD-172 SS1]